MTMEPIEDRAAAVARRYHQLRAATDALHERSRELCHETLVMLARMRAGRRGADAARTGLNWMVVEGSIEGRTVQGAWSAGRLLHCHPSLDVRARILVDLEETFVSEDPLLCVGASLEEPAIAVALTLIRACDRVTAIDLG
jgi:hypothetical protein